MPNKDAWDVPPEPDYTHFWTTRDGEEIAYTDMTTAHLENVYNMLEKMLCAHHNRCHDYDEYYDPPEWVSEAMSAVEKELGRREINHMKKLRGDFDG